MAQGSAVSSSVPDQNEPPPADAELPPDEGADAAADAEAATEARAREMGWKPLAEYRGPPGKWQPAADFISRGENILPIVRDQNRRLTEKVGKLESEIGGLRQSAEESLQVLKEQRELARKADQRGYDRAMAELKTQQRQAVEAGDTTRYDLLVEQAEALASSRPAAAPPAIADPPKAPADAARPVVSPAVQSFVNQNPWFNVDQFLTRKMIDLHIDVIQEGEILDEGAQLAEAKRRLVEDFPDRLGAPPAALPPAARPPRRRAPSVAAPTLGNEPPAPRPGAALTSIAQIADPADRAQAREAFNRTKRQLPDYTEAEYMALYDDPHGDVLTLQQQKPRRSADGR